MQKGWNAEGLLQPLWSRYGGEDAKGRRELLAAATETTGVTLSAVNSGARPLGISLATRLAEALGVGLADLGAPAEVLNGDERPLHERVLELERRLQHLERLLGER